jgi:predicted SprT family Zn-dependent metalloprotease
MIKEILKIKNLFHINEDNLSIKNKNPKDFETFRKFMDLARSEMEKNGLFDWKLDLDYAKVRAGACFFKEKKISFSRNFIKNASDSDIYDTILHEIAHALVGPKHGHDIVWKTMAKKIGCSAKRCHTLEFSDYKWIKYCKNHCWEQKSHRRKSNLICRKCGSTVFYKKNI